MQITTPVVDFIHNYTEKSPLRLHMPGHKGKGEIESLDITEIRGADPLYPAQGILRESEENAAMLFGAGRTIYSAEGSSLCIRAMLMLAAIRAKRENLPPVILAGRNAHSVFLRTAALLNLEIRWLYGPGLLTCLPAAEELESATQKMKTPPAAVYLTSPDYLGNRADIRGLARVCHAHGIPLLVDNAHGAYLRFLPEDQHPLSLGADLTCDSAHKTLPVLTGGAYLHIHRDADPFFAARAEEAMAMFASTSPSWLILRSLDQCNAYLSETYPERLAEMACLVRDLKERLRAQGFALTGDEELKITLMPKSRGYTGNELHEMLREKNMECEFSDQDHLVMMVTPETGAEGLNRLESALRMIPERDPLGDAPPALPKAAPVLSPAEAIFSPSETIPAADSVGRILADPCVSCPPAVPILVSGERISEEAVRCFQYYGIDSVSCITGHAGSAK